jgi:glutathione S-transferase
MSLTFYYGSGSPYAWRVWLALEHKQVPYELRVMSFSAGDLRTAEYSTINPRQKVPSIVDDGFALYESVAIVEYLDERYADAPSLFPGDARRRALVRRLVQEADRYLDEAMGGLVDRVLFTPPDKWDAGEIAQARAALGKELERWETMIGGDFLGGSGPSAADYALYPSLALALRAQKKKPDLDVAGVIGPAVSAWMRRLEALPYFRKTWPPHWK